ncbi:MAG: SDR family oxidoreductase [Pseudomonadales bacterium]
MSKGIALVTGASAGIGAALARQFASQGFDLILTARRQDKLTELANELATTVTVSTIACDLSLAEGPAQLIAKVAELDRPIDILINNAGVAYSGAFESLTPDEVKNLVALNLNALVTLTHHYLPAMIERGSGRILNVASVAGFQPIPSMSLYAASKAFVLSLSEGISEELRGTGVSITALCPGLTRTEMVAASSPENMPLFMMSSVEDVAREGYEALMAREVIRIPGIANQAAVTWAKFQPRWLVRGLGGLYARLNPQKR